MTTPARFTTPPSLADLDALAQGALETIPVPLRRMTEGLAIRIEEFPDEDVCVEMELESPYDLLGLYQGVALPFKSVNDAPDDVDRVFLYRAPILDYWCETGEDLTHIVRHVLIHEIGHHFGFSDDDMEGIEAAADDPF
ncbi:metallopeptidase family protein [Roseospira marina]|uniref:Metallopeptidase family protein n=1 Tax=Roseospira marina TaxID=140057 RepID=A0A5M6IG59_9PROT|nr:metallopeptidase family protein [Roseospira marina]KAA5606867.1 metallopeptidase family protein [Roseospira marina]MBB4312965.1 putative Zn-dependent protease with MMP-like domain [Roseospira marina]MBB5086262.1 putative Zn-dependent protease with MMP-like domain [Roseospira marina]